MSLMVVIRVLSGRRFRGGGRVPWVTLRSPTAKCLAKARLRVLSGRLICYESNMGTSSTDAKAAGMQHIAP